MTVTNRSHVVEQSSPPESSPPRRGRLAAIVGPAIVVVPATAAIGAALAAVARAVLDLDPEFAGTQPNVVAATMAAALIVGAGVLAVSTRRDGATRRFERIATVVVGVSLVGPVTTLWTQPPDGPAHHRPQTMATLVALHLVAYVGALTIARRALNPRTHPHPERT